MSAGVGKSERGEVCLHGDHVFADSETAPGYVMALLLPAQQMVHMAFLFLLVCLFFFGVVHDFDAHLLLQVS